VLGDGRPHFDIDGVQLVAATTAVSLHESAEEALHLEDGEILAAVERDLEDCQHLLPAIQEVEVKRRE
jgi:hypothetical protein